MGIPMMFARTLLAAVGLLAVVAPARGDPAGTGSWVSAGPDGRLAYRADPQGNRIPDFSNCGYGGGGVAPPTVAGRLTVEATPGDMTAAIQAALDGVGRLPPDAAGFRGAVVLGRGTFHVGGTLHLRASGVVLRGAGQGEDGTVLVCEGTTQHNLIEVAGSGSRGYDLPREATAITDDYVPVGATAFDVADTGRLRVGQTVWVDRPATPAWLAAIGMDRIPPHRSPPEHDGERVQAWDAT
jgi:hypothetical protein